MADTPTMPKNPRMPAAGLDDIDLAILAESPPPTPGSLTRRLAARRIGVAQIDLDQAPAEPCAHPASSRASPRS